MLRVKLNIKKKASFENEKRPFAFLKCENYLRIVLQWYLQAQICWLMDTAGCYCYNE